MVDDPLISLITWFASTFPPRDWTFCAGQIIGIADNTALYSLLGTSYGGDGRVTFGIPDLRGRTPVGSSDMGNPNPPLVPMYRGQMSGFQTVTLNDAYLPTHNHSAVFTPGGASGGTVNVDVLIKANSADASEHSPGDGSPAALSIAAPVAGLNSAKGYNSSTPDVALDGIEASGTITNVRATGTVSMADSGSSQAFSIQNPYVGLNPCIAMQGTYPSRN